MYPQPDEVHNLVRKTAKDFVERRVEPNARRIDQGWFPGELLREMGELGLLAPHAPPEYGGPGLDFRSLVLVVEEVARSSPALATVSEVQGSMIVHNLMHYAGRELREKWLQHAVRGRRLSPSLFPSLVAAQTPSRLRRGRSAWAAHGLSMELSCG